MKSNNEELFEEINIAPPEKGIIPLRLVEDVKLFKLKIIIR